MDYLKEIGKYVLVSGIVLCVMGGCLFFLGSLPFSGKLPGDILIRKNNFTFYFPLATCLLVSCVLTFLFQLFRKW